MARLLLDRMNSPLEPLYADRQPGEPSSSVAAIEKAAALLGWRARCTLEEGIDEVIAYHRARAGAAVGALVEAEARSGAEKS